MDYYNNVNALKNFSATLLKGQFDVSEVYNFLRQMNERNEFDIWQSNYYCLIILQSLLETFDHAPIIRMMSHGLISRIIVYTLDDDMDGVEEPVLAPPAETVAAAPTEEKPYPDAGDEHNVNKAKMQELKDFFIKRYPEFPPNQHPELKYPLPGEKGSMILQDAIGPDNKRYTLYLGIDNEGRVIGFDRDPIPYVDASQNDYSAIYENLLGQMLDYQRGKADRC